VSKFDTSRDRLLVSKGLQDKSIKYFPYENVLKIEKSNLERAKDLARVNFKPLAKQNMLRIQKEAGLTRKQLI
jgi:hypothetical protein